MNLRRNIVISLVLIVFAASAQKVQAVWKIEQLQRRISSPDTIYVVNFWASWCKPCVEELPAFDSLDSRVKAKPVRVLLVNIDFKEDLNKKVNPFLKKKAVRSTCVLLDEIDGNRFINGISPQWSGAIPGTLIKKGDRKIFLEKKVKLAELEDRIVEISQ